MKENCFHTPLFGNMTDRSAIFMGRGVKMYQIIIIDDERMIVEGLQFLIGRDIPECSVIGIAFDGRDGLNMAKEMKPDIIITDIRMPGMDGIEMIERLKEAATRAKFIILSGYSEFAYAKKAIALGVEYYITKPVEEEELYAVVQKVCTSIESERTKESTLQYMEQSARLLALREMLSSGSQMDSKKNMLKKLGFMSENKKFVCAVFEFNNHKLEAVIIYEELLEGITSYLTNADVEVLHYTEDQFVIILSNKKALDYAKLVQILCCVRAEIAAVYEMDICAGIGTIHDDFRGIKESFQEAMKSLDYKVLKGMNAVIMFTEIRSITENSKMLEQEDIKKLELCIDNLDKIGCSEEVDVIFEKMLLEDDLSITNLQLQSLNIVLLGIRKMPFVQLQLNEMLGQNILSLERIAKFKNVDQIKNWLKNTINSFIELTVKQKTPEKRDIIMEIKEYINQNYDKDIGLADISKKFFINQYYFSQLFRKKTGETYQNYVITLRIDRAKKLLKNTDMKVYEVCNAVGYTDARYFSRLFERLEGCKPSEYKRRSDGDSNWDGIL